MNPFEIDNTLKRFETLEGIRPYKIIINSNPVSSTKNRYDNNYYNRSNQ